ncbi:MAG: FAD:protein FMN transferase [Acidobacteriota bacterium]|nr:FAD:protein FMN transferase [Acidobacteriota bacterium]
MLRLESSVEAMGSTYSVVLYGPDREVLEHAAELAFDEARRLDDELSNYKPESPWSQVNRHAAERPVPVPVELFDLLSACLNYSKRSEGAFDITVGPLMRVWGFYKGSGHLPKPGDVKMAMTRVGYRNIKLDAATHSVRFAKTGVEMDPGGIGKGFAVDKMAEILRKAGIEIALISGSGSSIYAMGAPPGEKGWTISIRDPHQETKTVQDIVLKDESLSTSGSYEKFFEADGRVYAHIMDPRTGYPARGMLSVSVITPRTIDSEAWCKPFFINGRAWAAQHKPEGSRAYFCEDKTQTECVWLQ